MSDEVDAADPRASSPCIDVCTIDPRSGFCDGCRRTMDEIAWWASYPTAERRRILDELPSRA